ncbi:MAG: twin-arginine translocase TatA/TatE family subunit [Candidatus Gastranaerophilales bacterium]|nr:twin-arginine translocase TatA/TatE family subunit [Candidatus Gastranaerophilales bacterium]
MSIGIPEIALILIVILLLFGGKRIPELAKAFGRASYEYKKAKEVIKKEAQELKDEIDATIEKPQEYQIKDNAKEPEV